MCGTPDPQSGEKEKPPERNREASPKPHWAEIATLIILAVVGFFQIRIYNRQADIMEIQTKLAEADERPWVKPKIQLINPVFIDDFSFSFGFQYTLENSGKYPAFWVTQKVVLVRGHYGDQASYFKAHDELCDEVAAEQAKSVDNVTIFPKEAESGLGSTWGSPTQTFLTEPPRSKRMFPGVNGCIVYKGATDVVHHTWFSYQVVRTGPPEKAGWIEAIPGTIPANEIGLRAGPYGRNTAD